MKLAIKFDGMKQFGNLWNNYGDALFNSKNFILSKNAQAVCQDSLAFAYAFLSFRKLLLGRYGCRIGRNVERMQVYFF